MQHESVSVWLARLKAGDQTAAQPLWERFFHRLTALARSRRASRRVADEEDVALSAFDSFCRGAAAGRFPRLDDRVDLWRVLVTIVSRKAHDYAQHEQKLKRSGLLAQEPDVVRTCLPSRQFSGLCVGGDWAATTAG